MGIQQVYFAHDILPINVCLAKYAERLAQVLPHIADFQPDLIMRLLFFVVEVLGEDDDEIMKKIIIWTNVNITFLIIVSRTKRPRNIDINVYFFIKKIKTGLEECNSSFFFR